MQNRAKRFYKRRIFSLKNPYLFSYTLYAIRYTLVIIFALSFYQPVFAEAPVRVTARVLPSKATVGDEIKLFIQAERPRKFSVSIPEKVVVAPFELKRVEASPFVSGQNRVRETFILVLTIFELGDFKIPPVPVSYKDESGRGGQVQTEPVAVKVVSVGKKPTDKDDIRPIKGPVALGLRWLRTLAGGVLAALLSILLAVKIILRKRKEALDLESLKPPHERAMLELGRLQGKGWLEAGRTKEFYSELADILRRYLERRFTIESLELTTFELVRILKEKEFDAGVVGKIKDLLENSDLVKFAKFSPPKSLADDLVRELTDIVEMTTPKENTPNKM